MKQKAFKSLQCPVEMNTNGSKTPTTYIIFHMNYGLQRQVIALFFHCSIHTILSDLFESMN